MVFEDEDDDLREIVQLAKGMLRSRYYKWALWCGVEDGFKGWVLDQISMGIALAYSQIGKWDSSKYPSFAKWACYKIEDQAKEDLRKRTRRKLKQPKIDEVIEELMAREPRDGFETCISQDSLKGVLKRLNPVMQTIVALYYCGGLTDLEISRFLKMNLSTIQSNRQRALARAREHYVLLHSSQALDSSSSTSPRTHRRKPRDSTESPGEEPPPEVPHRVTSEKTTEKKR